MSVIILSLLRRANSICVFIGLLPAIILIGCSSTQDAIKPGLPAAEKVSFLMRRDLSVHTLEAEGSISVFSKQDNFTMPIVVKLRNPDTLIVFLDNKYYVGRFVQNECLFRNRDNRSNKIMPLKRGIYSLFRLNMEYNVLHDLLSGTIGGELRASEIQPTEVVTQNTSRLIYIVLKDTVEYTIDHQYGVIKEYRKIHVNNRAVEVVSFDDYQLVSDVHFPHKIVLERPQSKEKLTIIYDKVVLNPEWLDLSFPYSK